MNIKWFLCSLTLGIASGPAWAQATPPVADINAAQTAAPISPYVYGQFLEHIGGLIYSGLWSERLEDRKFYYPVIPRPAESPRGSAPEPGFRRRNVTAGCWNPIGPVAAVTMDTNAPFVGQHSPCVQVAGAEPRGLVQAGVELAGGLPYTGHIQLAGEAAVSVVIRVVWETNGLATNEVLALAAGALGKDYQRFSFGFTASQSGPARFEILGTGQGTFHVGAVSLMPSNQVAGFRPEAIDVLKSLRSGVYRVPGGNFVSAHEWRDAIGDPDKRAPTWDPVWRAMQPNDIGTDELMTLCALLGVEPYITVNAGTGDAWSAAQLVEYCNGEVATPMGAQRAANGHPAPYHVKFWGIGNEMWGISYQFGAMKPAQYFFKHNQFARAMRRVDPGIVLIASGAMPDTMTGSKESLSLGTNLVPPYLSEADWTGGLLTHCFDAFDLISEHFYNYGATHFDLAAGKQVPNDPNEPITDWMRRPANHIRIKYEEYLEYAKRVPALASQPKPLNIDEWAYSGGNHPLYPAYAWVFQEMFRHSDIIQMAAYTFGTSLLAHHGTNVTLNANGMVFKFYRDHFGTLPVTVGGNAPQPKPVDPPGGEQPEVNAGSPTFPLDVVAAWTTDHQALTVAVLNPTDQSQSLTLNIAGASLTGQGTRWRLGSADGSGRDPNITSAPISNLPGAVTVPPFSVDIYELPTH